MTWNKDLAAFAQKMADKMAATNQMKHSSSSERRAIPGFSYVGENLAMGATGARGVQLWYDEIKLTSGGIVTGFSSGTGHYTQVVWKGSTSLGCGENGRWLCCVYGPGGNMGGAYTRNVFAPTKSAAECANAKAPAAPGAGSDASSPAPSGSVTDRVKKLDEKMKEAEKRVDKIKEKVEGGGGGSSTPPSPSPPSPPSPPGGSGGSGSGAGRRRRAPAPWSGGGGGSTEMSCTVRSSADYIFDPNSGETTYTLYNYDCTMPPPGAPAPPPPAPPPPSGSGSGSGSSRRRRAPSSGSGGGGSGGSSGRRRRAPSSGSGGGGSAPSPPAPSSPPGTSLDQELLDKHNQLRCMHGVPLMTWNKDLAAFAQKMADKMAATNQMKHSSSSERRAIPGFSYVGENLAMGATGARGVQLWYDEIKLTNGGVVTGFSSGTGHYTQVVWKGSTSLGCGQSGRWLCCNYGPGGNMGGAYASNVNGPTKSAAQCANAKAPSPTPSGGGGGGNLGSLTARASALNSKLKVAEEKIEKMTEKAESFR